MDNEKEKNKRYNVLDSALAEIIYIVFEFVITGILLLSLSLGAPREAYMSTIFSFLIELSFLGTVLIVSRLRKKSFVSCTTLDKRITPFEGLMTAVVALIALFGLTPITNVFVSILDKIGYSSNASLDVDTWAKYVLYVFTMCAVPAFCEEMLFRGVIYNGLRKWNKTAAVFVSALLFMLMHGSPDQTIHQFLLGVILAMLFSAAGSIWAPMLLHFINNFVALTTSFIYSQITVQEGAQDATETTVEARSFVLNLIVALAITAAVFFVIREIVVVIKKKKAKEIAQAKEQVLQQEQSQEERVEVVKEENVAQNGKTNKIAVVLFVISGIYLIYEWVSALLKGMGMM